MLHMSLLYTHLVYTYIPVKIMLRLMPSRWGKKKKVDSAATRHISTCACSVMEVLLQHVFIPLKNAC